MEKQRLVYRVLLKLMTFIAALILFVVFINSLFLGFSDEKDDPKEETSIIKLSGMTLGEIRKTRWNGHDVAVLKRAMRPSLQKISEPQQLNQTSRSILPGFFVYFNTGDSGNCPLFFDGKTFKDICSGKYYDTTGRGINSQKATVLKIPPHFFETQDGIVAKVVIGLW